MSDAPVGSIGIRLRGDHGALRVALDRLFVVAEVTGVVEGDGEYQVWLRGALPDLDLGPVVAESLAVPQGPPPTGREGDRPILVAPDLMVRPPWVAPTTGFDGVELVVPRGGAFGSGEHASTRGALLALHAIWEPPVSSFADIGTGSGILALYALRRGCASVAACDIDPAAVRAARELLAGGLAVHGGPDALPAAADLVVANLNGLEMARALAGILAHWTGRHGLVLSGLRVSEVDGIAGRLPRAPDLVQEVDEFRALALRRLKP